MVNSIHICERSCHVMSRCFLLFREAVDTEGDGDVSKEEFVKNAMQSKFIFNMLKN